jgi:hypothetical protein
LRGRLGKVEVSELDSIGGVAANKDSTGRGTDGESPLISDVILLLPLANLGEFLLSVGALGKGATLLHLESSYIMHLRLLH